jgi:hypothetical protein
MSTPYSTSIVLATEDSQRSQKMSAQSTWVSCETTVSLSVHDCSHEPGPLTLGLITECDWEESTGLRPFNLVPTLYNPGNKTQEFTL